LLVLNLLVKLSQNLAGNKQGGEGRGRRGEEEML